MADDDPTGDADATEELERAPEFLVQLDADLRITYHSRTPPGVGDVVGRAVTDFVPAQFHDRLRETAAVALHTGRPQHFKTSAVGPDGQDSWYSIWFIPTASESSDARLTLVATDLTQRVRTEEALEEERSVLRSLVDNAPDYILILDRGHRLRFINRIDRGFTENMLLGTPAEDFLPEAAREGAHAAIESVFETGQGTSYESEVETPAGVFWYNTRIGPVSRDGRVDRVSLVSTDITDAKRLEQGRAEERASLAQSEARFRTMVDAAPEALAIFDVESGLFDDVNPGACELFDLPRDELLKRGPLDVSAPTTPDGRRSQVVAAQKIEEAVGGGRPVFLWTHVTGSGREVPCEVRLVLLPHPERVLLRVSLIDISERLQAESERARLNDELFQARKMQAIGQLTGGIAHDFNNLLTVIMSHAELILERAPTPERARGHAEQVLEASRRASTLTQQLLAFARRQPLRPRDVDLASLVSELEELLRRTLGETIEVRTILPQGLWRCKIDPVQMENALLNLAINARDAMPEGGLLTIEVSNVEQPPEGVAPDTTEPGPHVLLVVRDTGTGMTREVRTQAFEPFFTTKDVGKGSGLGLSMVYGFVSQSGGQVRIASTPGQGTEVAIYLPRGAGHVEGAKEARGAEARADRGDGELLLVVEDDPHVRAATVEGLRELGYRTLEAEDASPALRILAGSPEIALLLSDVVLPGGVSGPELALRARDARAALPVVFMSGYPREGLAGDARPLPEVMLLRKPFTHAELAAAIQEALGSDARDARG